MDEWDVQVGKASGVEALFLLHHLDHEVKISLMIAMKD